MSSLKERIELLESDLKAVPPRISVYHDLPFAILRYDPSDEWELRREIRLLATRHPVAVIAPILWTDEWAAWWKGGGSLPRGRRVMCDGITVDHPRYLYPPKVLRGWYGHCFRESVRPAFRKQ